MTISDYNKKNCMQGLCDFIEIALAHCKLHGLSSNCTGSLEITWVEIAPIKLYGSDRVCLVKVSHDK